MTDNKPSTFSHRQPVIIRIVLIGIFCTVLAVVTPLAYRAIIEKRGEYSIESITLSSDVDWDTNRPVDITDKFIPSDTVYCTVTTSGANGKIGMRIYSGENLIDELTDKTKNNVVNFYFNGSKYIAIPEGRYRVEIYKDNEAPKDQSPETVYFEVKTYYPTVQPSISIPAGHKNIDIPKYTEVPFAFDEVWKIEETEWKVNEVKIVLLDKTQGNSVAVVIHTDMSDLATISEGVAKTRTRSIALHAIENGYVEKAKSLKIDGINLDLSENIFVILRNPANQSVLWVEFLMDELK